MLLNKDMWRMLRCNRISYEPKRDDERKPNVNSLYSSSSRALTFPDFLIRQMDLPPMSVFDLFGPSTAMPAENKKAKEPRRWPAWRYVWWLGVTEDFKLKGYVIFIEGVYLSIRIGAVIAPPSLNLEKKRRVCFYRCVNIHRAGCGCVRWRRNFIYRGWSLFLTGCQDLSMGVSWFTGLSSFHGIIERMSAVVMPSDCPSDGCGKSSSTACHLHAQ